ncbi:hypothetical protein QUF58_08795 [Anaerolineales bacterium HSG24]|nr:hypothetical protein [Anaerolineales bacterium HSG24]
MTTKQISLWSWLIRWSRPRKAFWPPELEDLNVTLDEFAEKLSKQISANELPATVELCEVRWDEDDTTQPRIAVEYTGDDNSLDVIQYLIGVNKMGRFTYVDETVCFKPPVLPKSTARPKDIEKPIPVKTAFAKPLIFVGWILIGWGVLSLLINTAGGEIAAVMLTIPLCGLPGFILVAIGTNLKNSHETTMTEWNIQHQQIYTVQKTWDDTVSHWLQAVDQTNYLSRTDDIPGRFIQSVSDTVEQVVKTLFEDRQAIVEKQKGEERTRQEIEAELEKRRQEGFK